MVLVLVTVLRRTGVVVVVKVTAGVTVLVCWGPTERTKLR